MNENTGMIISRDEARIEKDQVHRALEAGVIDLTTATEMAWETTKRTVPVQ